MRVKNTNRPLLGIGIMITAMAVFAVKDGIAKWIVADVPPFQLIWIQFTATFCILMLVTMRSDGLQVFRPTPFGWQLVRGLSSSCGVGVFYWSLAYLPLADATAVSMIAPIVVTVLSPFLLGETIGKRRVMAALFGFCGVLVILRPGFGGAIEGYLLAVLSGILFGMLFIGNRRLGNQHSPLVNVAHSCLIGMVLLAPVMAFVWVDIPQSQYLNLVGFQILAVFGQACMVNSFAFGQAAIIAAYQHTAIIFATLSGFLMFGDFPDWLTWIGIAMIVAAGVFIAWRERQLAHGALAK